MDQAAATALRRNGGLMVRGLWRLQEHNHLDEAQMKMIVDEMSKGLNLDHTCGPSPPLRPGFGGLRGRSVPAVGQGCPLLTQRNEQWVERMSRAGAERGSAAAVAKSCRVWEGQSLHDVHGSCSDGQWCGRWCHCSNIIKCYRCWPDPKEHCINLITEFFTSGNLRDYRQRHKHFELKAVKKWARQVQWRLCSPPGPCRPTCRTPAAAAVGLCD